MKPEVTEAKLRALFQKARALEAAGAPDFRRLSRPEAAPGPARVAWLRPAVALAAGVLCAGVIFFLILRKTRQPETELQQWTAISNWRAPTDELLTLSSMPWGCSVTTPTDAWIDTPATAAEATQPKEKEIL